MLMNRHVYSLLLESFFFEITPPSLSMRRSDHVWLLIENVPMAQWLMIAAFNSHMHATKQVSHYDVNGIFMQLWSSKQP